MKYVKYREYCDVMVNRVIYYFIAIPILNVYPVAITYLLSLYYMENTQYVVVSSRVYPLISGTGFNQTTSRRIHDVFGRLQLLFEGYSSTNIHNNLCIFYSYT